MIWFDSIVENKVSGDQIRRAISAMTGDAYHDISIIRDILDLSEQPVTCLVQELPVGGFAQQLTFYVEDRFSSVRSRLSIDEAAQLLSMGLGVNVMIANDASASPYAMILLDRKGGSTSVNVNSTLLDEQGIYRLDQGGFASVPPVSETLP